MRITLHSVALKFAIFLGLVLFALLTVAVSYWDSFPMWLDQYPREMAIAMGGVFLLIFLGFYLLIGYRLSRVSRQSRFLLTGKKYKRFLVSTPDEIGLLMHFFNKITHNIEKLSDDIAEQKETLSELNIAKQIQEDVLPREVPKMNGLDVVAKTRSAREVGGDSFDFIETKNGILVYIGDVAGHGISAGLVMIMANTLIRVFSQFHFTPNQILSYTNDMLHSRISSQRFMTMVMLRWNPVNQQMYYTGAGHEHILVYRAAEKKIESIRSGGVALRMFEDIGDILEEKKIQLNANDVMVLYTDGITEARNANGEMYDYVRLEKALKKYGPLENADRIFDSITHDFASFVKDERQEDDITMLVIRRLKEGEPERRRVKLIVNLQQSKEDAEKWKWD